MDYKKRFEDLTEELTKRCTDLIELRGRLLQVRMELHEFYAAEVAKERDRAFAEGYAKGWQEARADASWDK